VQLFLSKGAIVYGADLQPPKSASTNPKFTFISLDVTSWPDLCELFSKAHSEQGRIDIVYANAGIYSRENYLSLREGSDGKFEEPSKLTFRVNLDALANQVALGAHYMTTKQPLRGGSIILTASSTSYQRFDAPDYVASKHGVIGLMRGTSMHAKNNNLPLRINAVAPSWTRTGTVTISQAQFEKLGVISQPPEAVARSVALLATDETRSCQCIYSRGGEYVEMEEPMHATMLKQFRFTGLAEEDERQSVLDLIFGSQDERT
jgi:NAD(P)-dependent dehydrogenase (short-subunit alcohol dehydrogenase family)